VIRCLVLVAAVFGCCPVAGALPAFEEKDGRIVIEVESQRPAGYWRSQRQLPGFTGKSYYTWRGPNTYAHPGIGVLTYVFDVKTPGTYQLRIRNRHDYRDNSLRNDCFTRIDGGKWIKTYSSTRGAWTFSTIHDLGPDRKPNASYELEAGRHVLQISGRSYGFSIDRIHLFNDEAEGGEDASAPETRAVRTLPAIIRPPTDDEPPLRPVPKP